MAVRIRVRWEGGAVCAELEDTPTTRLLAHALPWSTTAQTWGCELYFEAPVRAELDPNPRVIVDPGTVCFWVQGSSVAIPYGATPVSERGECRLVTAANVIGKLEGDAGALAAVPAGVRLHIERAEQA